MIKEKIFREETSRSNGNPGSISEQEIEEYVRNSRFPGEDQVDLDYTTMTSVLEPRERQQVIMDAVDQGGGTINWAHIYLAFMVRTGYVRTCLTTNFDNLLQRSLALFNIFPLLCDHPSSAHWLSPSPVVPQVVHLHGSLVTYDLKNTPLEVAGLEAPLTHQIASLLGEYGLVIVGYRGAEAGIMDALIAAITPRAAPYGVFWVSHERDFELLEPQVQQLLTTGQATYWIPGQDADRFFYDLCSSEGLRLGLPNFITNPLGHMQELLSTVSELQADEARIGDFRPIAYSKKVVDEAVAHQDNLIKSGGDVSPPPMAYDRLVARAVDAFMKDELDLAEELSTAARLVDPESERAVGWLGLVLYRKALKANERERPRLLRTVDQVLREATTMGSTSGAVWGARARTLRSRAANVRTPARKLKYLRQAVNCWETAEKVGATHFEDKLGYAGTLMELAFLAKKPKETGLAYSKALKLLSDAHEERVEDKSVIDRWLHALSGFGFYARQVPTRSLSATAMELEQYIEQFVEKVRSDHFNSHQWELLGGSTANLGAIHSQMNSSRASAISEGALRHLSQSLELDPSDENALYDEMCVLSIMGKVDDAISRLASLVSKSESRKDQALNDPDLDNCRQDPRFGELVSKSVP